METIDKITPYVLGFGMLASLSMIVRCYIEIYGVVL